MKQTLRNRAILLSIGLFLILLISGIVLAYRSNTGHDSYTASIYQNGSLIMQIDLSAVSEPYTLTVTAPNGGSNTILVEPGKIAVTAADCPDQVCVHQGAIRNSLLPITCLPHKLVIELHSNRTAPDTITY